MKTAKDQKINYLKYEKEHRKPAMSRILTAACLLWMFITAAAEASSASQASLALQSAAAAGTAQTFTMNTFRYVVLFTIATAVPYNDLFYIREQEKTVPVLSKYRFAPVDIRKMRRAKTFLDHLYRHRPWLFRFKAPLEHAHTPVRVCPALLSLPDCRDAGQRADPFSALRFTSSFPDVTTMVTPSTIRSTATIS